MLTRRVPRDQGFTLIELVMTIGIMAIISVALIGMLFGYVRNANETSTRLNESSDQQFVAAYWQNDVSSLGVHDVPASGTNVVPVKQSVWTVDPAPASVGVAPRCSSMANVLADYGGSPASPALVAGFAWNDYPAAVSDPTLAWSSAVPNAAVYWTQVSGTQIQLWRTRCTGSSAGSSTIVAHYLIQAPVVTCLNSSGTSINCASTNPALPASVSITLAVQDRSQAVHGGPVTGCPASVTTVPAGTGYCTTLTAERRQG